MRQETSRIRILIASHNKHKAQEFCEMLGDAFEVVGLPAGDVAPEETGATFEENARLKALAASSRFEGWVLADDSGLEVDALGGEPGVQSARYSGDQATDATNRTKLLAELDRVGAIENRTARFRCVIAIARHGIVQAVFNGTVEGNIGTTEVGTGGFGYDSLFTPVGYEQTFAELGSASKHGLSHRGKAAAQAVRWLKSKSIQA